MNNLKFNGTQKDLAGNPALDLFTVTDENSPAYGTTIAVKHPACQADIINRLKEIEKQWTMAQP